MLSAWVWLFPTNKSQTLVNLLIPKPDLRDCHAPPFLCSEPTSPQSPTPHMGDCHCQGSMGVSGLHAPCSLPPSPYVTHTVAATSNYYQIITTIPISLSLIITQHHPLNPTQWCQDSKTWKDNSILEKVGEASGTESQVIWVLALKLRAVASTSTVTCPKAVEEYNGVGKSVGRRASLPRASVTLR